MDTRSWVSNSIFYQIFPDRFCRSSRSETGLRLEDWKSPPTAHGFKGGDLWGVAERLDYLQDLGVDALYLNPIFQSAANHRYHTQDYMQVDRLLGGNEAFEHLLKCAHQRSMKVVLDGVFNHASRGFFAFYDVLENGNASPYIDWFHFDHQRLQRGQPIEAYVPLERLVDAPQQDDSMERLGYRAWWGLAALPKLNTDHPAVREYIFQVAEHWVRQGIDGWRLDVPAEIDDDAFWQEFRHRVKAIHSDAYIVGEIWEGAHRWLKGDQFDGVTNYRFAYPVLAAVMADVRQDHHFESCGLRRGPAKMSAAEMAHSLGSLIQDYRPSASLQQMNFVTSHDTARMLTLAGGDRSAVELILGLLFAYPGAPCLYYGEEIGMQGGHDPECRGGFPWDDAKAWDRELLSLVQKLIQVRKRQQALKQLAWKVLDSGDEGVAIIQRGDADQKILICFNLARHPKSLLVKAGASCGRLTLLLASDAENSGSYKDQAFKIDLQPRSFAYFGLGEA